MFGSVTGATPAWSEPTGVTTSLVPGTSAWPGPATARTPATSAASVAARTTNRCMSCLPIGCPLPPRRGYAGEGAAGWRGGGGAGRAAPPPKCLGAGGGRGEELDRAEEPVGLVVRAGREEQRVHGAVVRGAVAELERPQAVDRDLQPVLVADDALVVPAPVGELPEGLDDAVAEVPDQQVARERAEPGGRGHREAPRGVHAAVRRDAVQELAVQIEHVDDPGPRRVHLVAARFLLLGVRDEDAVADRLDPER